METGNEAVLLVAVLLCALAHAVLSGVRKRHSYMHVHKEGEKFSIVL